MLGELHNIMFMVFDMSSYLYRNCKYAITNVDILYHNVGE